jgi:hypothetical protein
MAEGVVGEYKTLKPRKKWRALYGPLNGRIPFHILDIGSWNRFENTMVLRGAKGTKCTLKIKYVTRGDPESSPEPEARAGRVRKALDLLRRVYSDGDDNIKKNAPPIKKPWTSAILVVVKLLAEDRKT